jgi:hypothetical protein
VAWWRWGCCCASGHCRGGCGRNEGCKE